MKDEKNDATREDGEESQPDSELWRRIDGEAEMLRRRTTPAYLKQQIMDALPEEPPKPWYERILRRG
jgi:hypothetical protein